MINKFSFHVSISDEEVRTTSYEDLKRKVLQSAEATFVNMYINMLKESLHELEGAENETL